MGGRFRAAVRAVQRHATEPRKSKSAPDFGDRKPNQRYASRNHEEHDEKDDELKWSDAEHKPPPNSRFPAELLELKGEH